MSEIRQELHIVEEELVLYALGIHSDARLHGITAHIALCTLCRAQLAAVDRALAGWSASQLTGELPEGVRDRAIARFRAEAAAPAQQVRAARQKGILLGRIANFRESLTEPLPFQIAAGALILLLAIVGWDDFRHISEIRQIIHQSQRFQTEALRMESLEAFLHGTGGVSVTMHPRMTEGGEPTGQVLFSPDSGQLLFRGENLPMPIAGKTYILWITPLGGKPPVAVGTCTPDSKGNAAIILPKIPLSLQPLSFTVTEEDAAGAAATTGPVVLIGQ